MARSASTQNSRLRNGPYLPEAATSGQSGSMNLPPHGSDDDPFKYSEHEVEIADDCIALAEATLAAHTPGLAARLQSSPEASGAAMLVSRRMLAGELPHDVAQIASGLIGHARDQRWPNWRDGLPERPPAKSCPSCATEMPGSFKRSWQWCPACGSALG